MTMTGTDEPRRPLKPLSLKSLDERLNTISNEVITQLSAMDDKLKAIIKPLILTAQSIQKLSDNIAKVGAGNVNAQQVRDMIFKRLNVKTGWAKADIKAMIDGIFNLLGK